MYSKIVKALVSSKTAMEILYQRCVKKTGDICVLLPNTQ